MFGLGRFLGNLESVRMLNQDQKILLKKIKKSSKRKISKKGF